MPTAVRSYAKINLGLAIGPPRPDGFHSLRTLYQTLALHDFVTVSARLAPATRITLTTGDPRVPTDQRNTVWKMVEKMLAALHLTAEVEVRIEKRLPIQGGMGAGSANAAAALLGLERELTLAIPPALRLSVAAEVGSDVPLFLVGGAVLGSNRGELVQPAPELTPSPTGVPCVVALPRIGVSTPAAFRAWDRQLQESPTRDTIEMLSRTYASVFGVEISEEKDSGSGASGITPDSGQASKLNQPENLQAFVHGQHHGVSSKTAYAVDDPDASEQKDDLAGNTLLALVRTGIENDFESVVFPQYPSLREIKRHLMGDPGTSNAAIHAALSGSGSALFGLYPSIPAADAAQQRLQQHGVEAIVTRTVARPLYWSEMFQQS